MRKILWPAVQRAPVLRACRLRSACHAVVPATRGTWSEAGGGAVKANAVKQADCIVVSHHFGDGVFGCGDIASTRNNVVVVTVFAGRPSPPIPTVWDARRPGRLDLRHTRHAVLGLRAGHRASVAWPLLRRRRESVHGRALLATPGRSIGVGGLQLTRVAHDGPASRVPRSEGRPRFDRRDH